MALNIFFFGGSERLNECLTLGVHVRHVWIAGYHEKKKTFVSVVNKSGIIR